MGGERAHGRQGHRLPEDRLGGIPVRGGEPHPRTVELGDGDVGKVPDPCEIRIGLEDPLRAAALTAAVRQAAAMTAMLAQQLPAQHPTAPFAPTQPHS